MSIQTDNHAQPSSNQNSAPWSNRTQQAADATEQEHSLTLTKAIKKYPKACLWSMAVSLTIIMNGYDEALIGSLFAFPAFQKRFGVPYEDGYQLTAKWQTGLGLTTSLGNVFGIFINGILTEKFGHKKTLLVTLVWLTGCIFIPFFAPRVEVLFVGELLCGIPWGVFTTMAPAYASEVVPVVLRSYLETYVVLCWGIGQLISYGILNGLQGNTTDWAWRIPFAVQWIWPLIIFPLICFCPESPWWLVRKGRINEAHQQWQRLSSSTDPNDARNAIALMIETTELERSLSEGASYLDCFRGHDLWRTEVSCVSWSSQALVGFAITSYATYFFEQAGLKTSDAYKLTIGQGGLHFLCVLVSIYPTGRWGRRPLFMIGASVMAICMLVIGFIALAPNSNRNIGYASAAIYMVWYATFESTIGPLIYIIVGEVSSSRLRSKSIALARICYNVFYIFSSCVAPYVLNPTEGNWKGKAGFLAAAWCLIVLVWAYFRLPETKGRTYEELDILFSKNLKAKDFDAYIINRDEVLSEKIPEVEHREN